jgi:TetR/AcrR family transcriptional regulator
MNEPKNTAPERGTEGKILEAARDEFAEYGLAGARVDRIAQRAGVNKAMIYYHFSSKENLYHEVFRSFFRHVAGLMKETLDRRRSLEDLVREVADLYARLVIKVSSMRPVMLRELANPHSDILGQIADILIESGLPRVIFEKLTEGQAEGTVRDINVRQATLSFILMNMGYILIAPMADKIMNVERREDFVKERQSAIVDLFLNGVKVRPA